MTLKIRLADNIEAQLACQLVEPGGVGVVAGAYGVDVMLLHKEHIPKGLLPADGIAGDRVAVVAVHAPELDVHAVEVHNVVLYLDPPKAHLLLDNFIAGGEHKGVLRRVLGVPEDGIVDGEAELIGGGAGACKLCAVGGKEGAGDLGRAVHCELNGNVRMGEVVVKALLDEEVLKESGGSL